MLKIAVLVSGGGTNLEAILKSIENGDIPDTEVVGVISNNKGVYALERAKNHGVPGFAISPADFPDREEFHKALLEKLDELSPDLIVLARCLIKIPDEMIRGYKRRIINIHPALIPSFSGKGFYGLRVHEAALQRGVRVSGATVHFVSSGLDEGPIILQKAVQVLEGDTPEILQRRIMEQAEWQILPEAVSLIADGRVACDENGRVVILPE